MDTYNDYNMPSDINLKLMQEMYEANSFNRRTSLINLYTLTHSFLSQCYGVEKKINHKLQNKLEEIKKELNLLLENLTLTFSFTHTVNNQNIINFNLFSSLKILTQIINELHLIENNEEKIYYKRFAKNSIDVLIKHLDDIFIILSESTVHIFKYI